MIAQASKQMVVLCLLIVPWFAGLEFAQAESAPPKSATHRPNNSRHSVVKQTEKNTMSQEPQSSRPAPPVIKPIEHKGVRYEQDMQSYDHGGDQPGGYLAAIDMKTGERLWMLTIYEVQDHSASGVDTIGLYFKSMKLAPERDELEIENESGTRFIVDLTKKTSTQVSITQPSSLPPIKIPE